MIASEEKIGDIQAIADLAALIEIAYKSYERTKNPEVLEHIYTMADTIEWLKNRVNTHDYTIHSLPLPTCNFTGESVQ